MGLRRLVMGIRRMETMEVHIVNTATPYTVAMEVAIRGTEIRYTAENEMSAEV